MRSSLLTSKEMQAKAIAEREKQNKLKIFGNRGVDAKYPVIDSYDILPRDSPTSMGDYRWISQILAPDNTKPHDTMRHQERMCLKRLANMTNSVHKQQYSEKET